MRNDDKSNGRTRAMTPKGHLTSSGLPCKSGAPRARFSETPGMMCQQGQDWSRGMACFPQKFVHLIGYRDPEARPSSPLLLRPMVAPKTRILWDTPIG